MKLIPAQLAFSASISYIFGYGQDSVQVLRLIDKINKVNLTVRTYGVNRILCRKVQNQCITRSLLLVHP